MTKSELFKAAHKLAKAFKTKADNNGDYVVYFGLALKGLIKGSKSINKEALFSSLNKMISKISSELELITYTKKVKATHGLLEESHEYKLKNIKLAAGEFLGKIFNKNGMSCAYITSYKNTNVAY